MQDLNVPPLETHEQAARRKRLEEVAAACDLFLIDRYVKFPAYASRVHELHGCFALLDPIVRATVLRAARLQSDKPEGALDMLLAYIEPREPTLLGDLLERHGHLGRAVAELLDIGGRQFATGEDIANPMTMDPAPTPPPEPPAPPSSPAFSPDLADALADLETRYRHDEGCARRVDGRNTPALAAREESLDALAEALARVDALGDQEGLRHEVRAVLDDRYGSLDGIRARLAYREAMREYVPDPVRPPSLAHGPGRPPLIVRGAGLP